MAWGNNGLWARQYADYGICNKSVDAVPLLWISVQGDNREHLGK
ncbi:MAG: hypothetical protein QNJ63_29930 [Calothrix sp. MO_192.B10]|nr:hypothetical protein [Calothrix sp. MO_192.B10]